MHYIMMALIGLLRTSFVLKPKPPCPEKLLSPRQIRTFVHPSGEWSLHGFSRFCPRGSPLPSKQNVLFLHLAFLRVQRCLLFSFCSVNLNHSFSVSSFLIATHLDFILYSGLLQNFHEVSLSALQCVCPLRLIFQDPVLHTLQLKSHLPHEVWYVPQQERKHDEEKGMAGGQHW